VIGDEAGPEQIRAGFAAALTAVEDRAGQLAALSGPLAEAIAWYAYLRMADSTVEQLREATGCLVAAQRHLGTTSEHLSAARTDFDNRDGRVADAVTATGNLMNPGDAVTPSPAAGHTGQDTPMTSEQTPVPPAPGTARQPMTDAEKAVLQAWSRIKVIDTSPETMRLRAEAEEIRRRHRPAPETNRYTGTIKVDDLGLDPEETLAEAAQHLRWTADMYDDRVRASTRPRHADADAALFWHAAADAVDAAAAAEPPASRAPWPGMDDESLQRWRHDEMILAQAQQLYGDEDTEEAAQLQREAAAIERRRKLAHRAAIKAGVTPCVASRGKHWPCVHPDGDHHEGLCFAADGESWPRHTSWWAPETWDNQHETTR
jgi:hypothetical protein